MGREIKVIKTDRGEEEESTNQIKIRPKRKKR